mgnify:FL=1|jgi:hypothetical protein
MIYATKLPIEIVQEIDQWVVDCKKIKDHKLSYLKEHDNVGTETNSYQIGVPKHHIDNGFFLAYLMRFSAEKYGGNHRDYFMRCWDGHFDGYDIWLNFAYEGDSNPIHSHAGVLSGVIYYKNSDLTPTIFPDQNRHYSGDEGTMVIFPSNTRHYVNKQISKKERISIAFNLNKRDSKNKV